MATQLQLRRGTTSENASFTGAVGEVTVDTTKDTLIVQDGSTAGGFELARADGSNFVATSVDINGGTIDGTTIGASSASTGAFTTLTASTGIDVTGTATMDGLTVENTSGSTTALIRAAGGGNNSATLDLTSRGSGNQYRNTEIVSVGENSPTAKLQFKLDNTLGNLSKALEIDGNGDISFYEDTGTTPKLFWDASAESLGIGTSSPATKLEVEGDSGASTGTVSAPVAIRITDTSDIGAGGDITNPYAALQFFSRDISNEGPTVHAQIGTIYDDQFGAGSHLTFSTWNAGVAAAAERMRIDSSGNVGIGRTPTSHILETAGEIKLTGLGALQGIDAYNTSSVQWGIKSTSASAAGVAFEVGNTERMRIDSSGNLLFNGNAIVGVQNSANNFYLGGGSSQPTLLQLESGSVTAFKTNGTERMRIDSSGNLLVGTTDNTLYNNTSGSGINLNASGRIDVTRGDVCLNLNRNTSDGSIIEFRKDGTAVGSIGSQSDHVYISASGATSAGLRLQNNSIISPTKNAVVSDNTIDLGQAGGRFKDLYLSGGVYLGGTGAANKLDDYEEGTWTPTAQLYSGTMTVNSATYTKIGNLVTLKASVTFDATTDNSAVSIQNVPFAHTGANKANGGYVTASTVATASKISGVGSGTFNLKDASGSAVTYTAIAGSTLDFVLIYETA